jgi:hypothetical protein
MNELQKNPKKMSRAVRRARQQYQAAPEPQSSGPREPQSIATSNAAQVRILLTIMLRIKEIEKHLSGKPNKINDLPKPRNQET